MKNISQRTRGLRTKLGISQTDFAALLGFSRNYVSMVERGEQEEPSQKFIDALKRVELQESVDELAKLDTGLGSIGQVFGPGIDARAAFNAALQRASMDFSDLAQKTGYSAGVLRAVAGGQGRASEKMIEAICRALPELCVEDLMGGSDHPTILHQQPGLGSYGSKPGVRLPPGQKGRFVPLLSWAQAGAMNAAHLDEGYDYQGVLGIDVPDPRAFALQVQGSSMEPRVSAGDHALVCPSWEPRSGDTVVAKTIHGDVMLKIYQTSDGGKRVTLSSHNPAYPPLSFDREEFEWIYPVTQILQNLRKH